MGYQRPKNATSLRPTRPNSAPQDFGDESAAPDVPAVTPADDPSALPQEGDDLEPQPRGGQRAAPKDGDLTDQEPPQLRDGVIETGEQPPPQDGIDPTTIDTRTREERQLFEDQASGVDALLFQTEELNPILDRRPQRLFRFEPYDPVGVRVGSFVLFPEAELSTGGFSNLFRSQFARPDASLDVRPSARLVSNWRTHALEFNVRGTATSFNAFPTQDETSYTLETRGRLDISKRANLQASLSQDVSQESRTALAARNVGTPAQVTANAATLALNQRFNRLSVQLRGAVTDTAFGDSLTGGVTTSNSARDYTMTEQAARASWEFKPTLSVFTEVAINQRGYARADATGLDRSSTGERYRAGVSFGSTGEIVRGEVSAGYGVQRPDRVTLSEISGLIVDANLTWKLSGFATLAATARSDFGETTATGAGGTHSQSAGLEARFAMQRDAIATAGIGYTVTDYPGLTLNETELRGNFGVEYFLNQETVLFSRYLHTVFTSNAPASSYDTDEVHIGVRIRR